MYLGTSPRPPKDDNGSWSWSENSLLTSNPDCHGACVQDPIFNIKPYSLYAYSFVLGIMKFPPEMHKNQRVLYILIGSSGLSALKSWVPSGCIISEVTTWQQRPGWRLKAEGGMMGIWGVTIAGWICGACWLDHSGQITQAGNGGWVKPDALVMPTIVS